ncbi:MAG TPA: 2,3-diphosphoglycerate-dependent phosphoglycerate mutase [Candidatus Pacearchaeota archaeon]|jgi:2,3-bisphosphoglycerate-dependent phosphoglycerate mutase|nr:2,3-diphosphoglycerate-dependent phosphoglycerate mutase [Candidatus Pacearchaeota archaeon]HRR94548.1 2,3-diphosphoglycerate-dependent phosphoglycerate mutase [Candidatus Paceibacterota bacterium]HPC30413.1 2,3-diphosphoglycerate-dependent phosphoglycerate mutase [Candidatus Pacearchaeota archaeon]HQG09093.1 2,3-diphosphoglycerate-dependent phosphoglycerate mutase [Candidatus Pacearchaeota archaeon]HQH20077.1 2,3-diphosphoglycerate-dependent phosphoglycerate mutase [Candidatus Pacearchaeota
MYKLVIVRHGESIWNKENIFTGWTDVPLSDLGREQAQKAGQTLKKEGYIFDLGYTSVLSRAIETLEIILQEMNLKIPIIKSWRLNERHYGALQGLNKDEIRKEYGEEKFKEWRRSYAGRPPALTIDDKRFPGKDPLYISLLPDELPLTESLKDTEDRVMPYWNEEIKPKILAGQRIIISAHGNSLRALVKNIENVSEDEIPNVEIPLGRPLIYEFDDNFNLINKFYL